MDKFSAEEVAARKRAIFDRMSARGQKAILKRGYDQLDPFQDPKDLAESPQLAAREFFVDVEHTELGDTITHCGPFIKLSETPLKKWRRAPLMGEHNREIYEDELGYTAEQLHSMKQAGII